MLTKRKLKFLPIVETTGSVRKLFSKDHPIIDYQLNRSTTNQDQSCPRVALRIDRSSFPLNATRILDPRLRRDSDKQKKKRSEINGNKKGGKKKERSEARATRS